MRLQARTDFSYGRKDLKKGDIFDAPDEQGLVLINQDYAAPFNLEDPAVLQDEVDFPAPQEQTPEASPKK